MRRLLLLTLTLCVIGCDDDSTEPNASRQLVLGALLSLTCPGQTLSQTSAAAYSVGVFLLSQGSTASSLAIPDDNVFRLVPDDSHEGQAAVALMWGEGIRTVVPLWRDDAGNQGLHDSVEGLFETQGGTVTSGAHYLPASTDFSAQLGA